MTELFASNLDRGGGHNQIGVPPPPHRSSGTDEKAANRNTPSDCVITTQLLISPSPFIKHTHSGVFLFFLSHSVFVSGHPINKRRETAKINACMNINVLITASDNKAQQLLMRKKLYGFPLPDTDAIPDHYWATADYRVSKFIYLNCSVVAQLNTRNEDFLL